MGLRIFTTDIGDVFGETYLDLVPIGAMDEGQRSELRQQIEASSRRTAPLYQATQDAVGLIHDNYDRRSSTPSSS